jgi:hypothetical protein
VPVVEQISYRGVGEHRPQQISLGRRGGRHVGVEALVGGVPAGDAPLRCQGIGGVVPDRVEEALQVRRHRRHLIGRGRGQRSEAGQSQHVAVLGNAEAQRAADGVEHLAGRIDIAALLQPGVPGDAHPGQIGDFLAAKPHRATAPGGRQTEVRADQTFAAGAQEGAEFGAAVLIGGHLPRLVLPLLVVTASSQVRVRARQ